MKHNFVILLILLIIITACSPKLGENCNQGVCIKIDSSDLLNDGSTIITITVTSDKEIKNLNISLEADPGIVIDESKTSDSEVWKGPHAVVWQIGTKKNQPLVLTRQVHFPHMEGSYYLMVNATDGSTIQASTEENFRVHQQNGVAVLSKGQPSNTPQSQPTSTPLRAPTVVVLIPPTIEPSATPWILPTQTLFSITSTPTVPAYPPPGGASALFTDKPPSPTENGTLAYPAP